MKRIYLRSSVTLMLLFCLLTPTLALAIGDGKKHFNKGMDYEVSEEWDKAAEEFALAVADNPRNPEYRLHLQRAMFSASQMFMKTGAKAAEEKNYEVAYNAFRKAYAFDPTNELAKSEMERMVRAQQGLKDGTLEEKKDTDGKIKLVQTGYSPKGTPAAEPPLPPQLEKLRDVPFPSGVNLQFIVKELAKDLDLNVLFDSESRLDTRQVKIELHNVTAAKALDYIFLQENLFFQKVGPRTILVASNTRRVNFQQLVLRTFYLANANPKDVKAIIQTAIPAQPGRSQTIVLEDAATNSITVRDTEENVRLIGKLIGSLDKDRAEVVMDVAIYEVNKNDLLSWGNQIGNSASLQNFGGVTSAVVGLGGNDNFANALVNAARTAGGAVSTVLPSAFGAGLILPTANLAAFQSKNNSKLIASTQIHAFNNEDSSARIGQRVPVKTASIQTGNAVGGGAVASDIISYEQVGLTLKFKPLVFPNQDVQVAMEIESKDLGSLDPVTKNYFFTERTIKGTARVQNNKTLLLASVAQGVESNGRQGLPLLGLIPILGNLFTAPTKEHRNVDIVIAITPKVIRAPAILPDDEIERPTGSLQTPTNASLEAMVKQEIQDEMLASARRLPNKADVQLPDQPADHPTYVRSTATSGAVAQNDPAATNSAQPAPSSLQPIDSGVKTLQIKQTADTSAAPNPATLTSQPADQPNTEAADKPATSRVQITVPANLPVMKVGERTKIAVTASNTAAFRSAVLGLQYDSSKLAVRSVQYGDAFGSALANSPALPFLNEKGKTYVSLSLPDGSVAAGSGIVAYVELEALTEGRPQFTFDKDVMHFLTPEGRNLAVSF